MLKCELVLEFPNANMPLFNLCKFEIKFTASCVHSKKVLCVGDQSNQTQLISKLVYLYIFLNSSKNLKIADFSKSEMGQSLFFLNTCCSKIWPYRMKVDNIDMKEWTRDLS